MRARATVSSSSTISRGRGCCTPRRAPPSSRGTSWPRRPTSAAFAETSATPRWSPTWPAKHTPYGASKLAADLYVQEYGRLYGLPTAVFRMSCICGPRQFGVEDQGWVAHFVICALLDRPITIYGDGKQVRDVLFVDDLVEAMQAFIARPAVAG